MEDKCPTCYSSAFSRSVSSFEAVIFCIPSSWDLEPCDRLTLVNWHIGKGSLNSSACVAPASLLCTHCPNLGTKQGVPLSTLRELLWHRDLTKPQRAPGYFELVHTKPSLGTYETGAETAPFDLTRKRTPTTHWCMYVNYFTVGAPVSWSRTDGHTGKE